MRLGCNLAQSQKLAGVDLNHPSQELCGEVGSSLDGAFARGLSLGFGPLATSPKAQVSCSLKKRGAT